MQNENYESKAMHCILLSAILFMNKNCFERGLLVSLLVFLVSLLLSLRRITSYCNHLQFIDIEIFDVKSSNDQWHQFLSKMMTWINSFPQKIRCLLRLSRILEIAQIAPIRRPVNSVSRTNRRSQHPLLDRFKTNNNIILFLLPLYSIYNAQD